MMKEKPQGEWNMLKKPKIAVVDDSEVALLVLQNKLPLFGFDVVTYDHAFGADTFIIQQKPDLLLLDVEMPALNGDALCSVLKSNKNTCNTRIYLYSSLPDEDLESRVKRCGADGYISKALDMVTLAARLRSIIVVH